MDGTLTGTSTLGQSEPDVILCHTWDTSFLEDWVIITLRKGYSQHILSPTDRACITKVLLTLSTYQHIATS